MLGRTLMEFWKTITTILAPILLCPLVFYIGTSEAKCGFVILLMAVFWVTDAVPLPVTALLPVVLLPLFGIMSTDDVCITYLKESNMMFIGSLIVAISVEKCNLHQRIALKALITIGTSPRLLMLGLMLPTMFLSMWISNTATTSMMVPIVEAIVAELDEETAGQVEDGEKQRKKQQKNKQRKKATEEQAENPSDVVLSSSVCCQQWRSGHPDWDRTKLGVQGNDWNFVRKSDSCKLCQLDGICHAYSHY